MAQLEPFSRARRRIFQLTSAGLTRARQKLYFSGEFDGVLLRFDYLNEGFAFVFLFRSLGARFSSWRRFGKNYGLVVNLKEFC